MKTITIDSKSGVWDVSRSKFATVFSRQKVARKKWNVNTTSVYRETYEILKLGDVRPLTVNAPKNAVWEVRYYTHSPPVKGEGNATQMPKWTRVTLGYSDAVGIVLDDIGYPKDNQKLREFLE